MPRARIGSVWMNRGKIYARVTWVDDSGKRHDVRRRAMDETHALALASEMSKTLNTRVQPNRAKKYKRLNLRIYCIQIQDGHVNPIKIGTSANIPLRIKMILCHQPYPVEVLASWPGSVRDERQVHLMFKGSHIAREWFSPTPDLLAYIASKNEMVA